MRRLFSKFLTTVVMLLFIAAILFFAVEVDSSGYRGGTISYRPNLNSPYSADFSFRFSFRRVAVSCDRSQVENRKLATTSHTNSWYVTRYGSGYTTSRFGNIRMYCSAFSVAEDWSEGYKSFTFIGGRNDDWWRVKVTDGGSWINSITHSNPNNNMLLNARVNKTRTGFFNNFSPVSSIPLTVYVDQGNRSVIRIPVEDPDGDIVRCRKASNEECSNGMCTYFPYGVLDEGSCILSYNGGGSVGQLLPIILKLEDYPRGTTHFHSSNSLGSVDLQFIVHIKQVLTGDLRIQGGGFSGRLQVLRNGVWGTVCDDMWSMTNTHVACRQLGFLGGLFYSNHGGASGPIWLDDVQCSGSESGIQQCRHNGWGINNCDHNEDVFVTCKPQVCRNYAVLNTRDRSKNFPNVNTLCDNSLSTGWYRFMGDAGTAIATSCVPVYHCDTVGTGWMQGSHPTQAEGIVTRRVCYRLSSNCCNWNNNIRVGHCGGFYVYELVRPPSCSLRYCGNGTDLCDSHPCLNGATCQSVSDSYNCTCASGFTGQRCETNISSCDSNPCLNEGTCQGGYNWYRCTCPSGFTGRECETNLKTSVTCGENFIQIDLKYQYFPGLNWRHLHLKNSSCKATKTAYTTRLRTPLNGCGTTYVEHGKKIAFWNEVRYQQDLQMSSVQNRSAIKRTKEIFVPFYCEYGREKLVSTSFSPSKKVVYASEGSYGNFTFVMDLYRTSTYSTTYSPFDYPVVVYPNHALWIQYEVKSKSVDLVVFAENCRATTSTDPDSYPQHVFLERGCVRDRTMVYWYNPYSRVQRFSIRSFRFVYSNTFLVYLHCELIVCHRNSTNSRCARGCISSRRRRETAEMEGSKLYDLSAGPLKGSNDRIYEKGDNGTGTTIVTIAVPSVVVVMLLVMAILIAARRKRDKQRVTPVLPANGTTLPGKVMEERVNTYEQHVLGKDEMAKIEI